jgi:hypothetical protein
MIRQVQDLRSQEPPARPAPQGCGGLFHGARMQVVKRHKRLWIDDPDGRPVYTPPDFVKLQSREPLWRLAEHFASAGRDIMAIAAFERRWTPKNR